MFGTRKEVLESAVEATHDDHERRLDAFQQLLEVANLSILEQSSR